MRTHYDETDKDLLVIESEGQLDETLAMDFIRDLYERIEKGLRKIIVDCSSMDFISSLDLSVLARLRSKVVMKGGELKFCGVSGRVGEVLRITAMDKLFEIHPDLESARRAFHADEGEGD